MSMACFVSSTAGAMAKPSFFTQKLNHNSIYFLQLSHSSIHLCLPIPLPRKQLPLPRRRLPSQALAVRCSSCSITPPFPPSNHLSGSTRDLLSVALATVSRLVASAAAAVATVSSFPTPSEIAEIRSLSGDMACSVGPLFFANLSSRPIGHLNMPIRAVVSGMGKWLDIYSGVLMVRVLLSWFPNIPWECQPFSAIRDLCDPYLDLFRNIIPPIFGNLDVSPIFAFTVLGVIVSILKGTPGMC